MVEPDEVSEGVSISCKCTNKIEKVNYDLKIKQQRCNTNIAKLGSSYSHMLPFYDKIKHGDSIVTLYFVKEEAEKIAGIR